MRRLRALYRNTWGRRRRLSLVVVLLMITYTIGFSTSFWLPLRLGYVLLFAIITAYVWSRLSLRTLRVLVTRSQSRVHVGQTIVHFLEMHNDSRLPKLWLEVEELTDLPAHRFKDVVSLGGRQHRNWRVETLCTRRGLFNLGPLRLRSSDPLDLFEVERTLGRTQRVLVYPQPLDLPRFHVPAANLPGEGRFRQRTHYVTPNAAGVREYEPGDSINRIHWPTSVRTGRLQVKVFELDPGSHLWIALDLHRPDHAGAGDESTVEYAVTAAASIARRFLSQNRSVGLVMFGATLHTVDPERGTQQLSRILEALALAQPSGDVPLSALLLHEARHWGRHTTVVVITASTDERWVSALQSVTGRGVRAASILVDAASFGGRRGADVVEAQLHGASLQVNRVRQGDWLPEVLGPPLHGGRTAKPAVTA